MKLLDKPLTQKEIEFKLDLVNGNICRICISDNPEEIIKSLGFAIDGLSMIAYSRVKEISNKEES